MENMLSIEDFSEEQLESLLKQKRLQKQLDAEKKKQNYEILKNETIEKQAFLAIELQERMLSFKEEALKEMDAIYDLLQDYSERHRDGKGNFSIENDNYRIIYRNRTIMEFDERADQAKLHILDFVNSKWDGDDDTRELILNLLNRPNGTLDVRDIQKLYKMENRFDNENWRIGLKLLKESYNQRDTKSYIRFEKKLADGSYQPIVLNFASL